MSGCGTKRRSAESAPKQAARQACFLEALADRPREVRQCVGRCIVKKSDDRFCRLLCAPRNRQRRRANKRDELTTSDAEHGLPTSKTDRSDEVGRGRPAPVLERKVST